MLITSGQVTHQGVTDRHIKLLDYIRGVAILAVLLCHVLNLSVGQDGVLPRSLGRGGVALFFVVSGFCIHLAFHRQGKGWRHFFIRRFFRIYPPYLAALAFSLLIIQANSGLNFGAPNLWLDILSHACLVHNFSPVTSDSINGAFWSLAVEAQLYLVYPALLVFVRRSGWMRTLIGLALCECTIRLVEGLMQITNSEASAGRQIVWALADSPIGYWFSWSIGAYVADAVLRNDPLPFRRIPPVLCLCLAFGGCFFRPLFEFQFPLFALGTAATISKVLSNTDEQSPESGLMLRWLKKLGLWSYSLYLIHGPLLTIYLLAITWMNPELAHPGPAFFLIMALTLIAIVPFSFLFYKVFEAPAIALGKRILGQNARVIQPSIIPLTAFLICVLCNLVIGSRFSLRVAGENNNRAWALATNPEQSKRNGALAVKLAESACRQTLFKNTVMLGTLAAAYAEAGRFDEAVSTAKRACALASASGDHALLNRNQELLGFYLQHQPYHQPLK